MTSLNISKVAFGCASLDALRRRQRGRIVDGEIEVLTRFRPKRADELVGGSLFWIIKHRLVARNTILGFAEAEGQRRTIIRLDPDLVSVHAWPRRAHQGWRYLAGADAPPDFGTCGAEVGELPADLISELTGLALL